MLKLNSTIFNNVESVSVKFQHYFSPSLTPLTILFIPLLSLLFSSVTNWFFNIMDDVADREPPLKRKKGDGTRKAYQHAAYLKRVAQLHNARYREAWLEVWKPPNGLFHEGLMSLFNELCEEFWKAEGDVYERGCAIFDFLQAKMLERSTAFNILPSKAQFMTLKPWARFTLGIDFAPTLAYYSEWCEKCYNETPQRDLRKYHPGVNFFVYLPVASVQDFITENIWLQQLLAKITGIDDKVLLQAYVMCDQVCKLTGDVDIDKPRFFHCDLTISGSMGLALIVFLDPDMSGSDGTTILHLKGRYMESATRGEEGKCMIHIGHVANTVLLMTGRAMHYADTKRDYGRILANINTQKTQRRFILFNICPYSRLNMLDQLLGSDIYAKSSPCSLKRGIFVVQNNIVSRLSEDEVTDTVNNFKHLNSVCVKYPPQDIKRLFK